MNYNYREKNGTVAASDAQDYKDRLSSELGLTENWVATAISGNEYIGWGPKAQMYDQLASTVTAIEAGQAGDTLGNIMRGMNAPALNVAQASRQLLDICREDLMKVENDPDLDEHAKKQKRKEIFGVLETIRIANAREKTWQWTRHFYSSIGNDIRKSMNWKKSDIYKGLAILACCVAALITVGICLSPALPIVLGVMGAVVGAFFLVKAIMSIKKAWKSANLEARTEKQAAAEKVLERAAAGAEDIDKETKEKVKVAESEMEAAKKIYDHAKKEYDQNEDKIIKRDECEKLKAAYEIIEKAADGNDLAIVNNSEVKKLYNDFTLAGGIGKPSHAAIVNYIKGPYGLAKINNDLLVLGDPKTKKLNLETVMKQTEKNFNDKKTEHTRLSNLVSDTIHGTEKSASDAQARAVKTKVTYRSLKGAASSTPSTGSSFTPPKI